jgi:hypothetical protein
MNEVDLTYAVFKLGLAYAVSNKFTVNAGYDYARMKGYHPVFAWDSATTSGGTRANAGTTVVDTCQGIPHIGFDYALNKDVLWKFDARFIDTTDKLNRDYGLGLSPQSYNGMQLMTQFNVKF